MTRPASTASKDEWRSWARQVRAGVDFGIVSRLVVGRLAEWRTLRAARAVLIYLPLGDEIDVTPLGELAIRVVTTRTPDTGGSLTVHELGGRLERHRYGFLQPAADAPIVADDDVDVVLTPGLSFDRRGGRLGRGAGYYDELFTRLRNARRVGVVPSIAVVDRLPTERHDVPMHHLATELGIAETSGHGS